MLKAVKYIFFVLLVTILAAYFAIAGRLNANEREGLACKGTAITIINGDECDFIHEDDIRGILGEKYGDCTGMLIDELDCDRIEKAIEEISAIKKCECHTDRTGMLNIDVYQRHPVLRLDTGNGGFYCDADGFVFPIHGSSAPEVTTVYGNIPEIGNSGETGTAGKKWLDGILNLNGYITGDRYWKDMFKRIEIAGNGDLLLIPEVGDFKIIFGNPENIKNKFYRIEKFYETIYPDAESKYGTVSVKYRDQIICKKKK